MLPFLIWASNNASFVMWFEPRSPGWTPTADGPVWPRWSICLGSLSASGPDPLYGSPSYISSCKMCVLTHIEGWSPPSPPSKAITLTAHLPVSVVHIAAFWIDRPVCCVASSRNPSRRWKYAHRLSERVGTARGVERRCDQKVTAWCENRKKKTNLNASELHLLIT